MTEQAATLSYAVRVPVVLKYFGQLCLVLAALTVVPLGASVVFGEYHVSARYAVAVSYCIAHDGVAIPLENIRILW